MAMHESEAVCRPPIRFLHHHIPQSSHQRLTADQLLSPVILRLSDMNLPSSPSTLQLLFDIALQDYEKQTGTKLADHPLAKELEICNTVESITTFLQSQARAFREFRGGDSKVMRFLGHVVHVLYTLSANAVLGEGIDLVCRKAPPDLGIFSLILLNRRSRLQRQYSLVSLSCSLYGPSFALCVYFQSPQYLIWQAIEEVGASYDTLLDLLESIEGFLNRLDIYTKFPPTTIMTEIIVKIMVELLSTLAVVTKQIKQGRPSESIFIDSDVLPDLI